MRRRGREPGPAELSPTAPRGCVLRLKRCGASAPMLVSCDVHGNASGD